MQDPPPRRTRRPPAGGAGTALPLVPILIGVIVLGFVIGAGLSLFGKGEPPIVSVAESPSAAATSVRPAPLADTPEPLPSPSPRPQSPAPRRSVLALRAEPRTSTRPVVLSASPPAAATAPALAANSATATAGTAAATDAAGTAAATDAAVTAATPVPAEASGSAGAADSPRVTPRAPAATAPAAAPVASGNPVVVSGSTTPFARLAASVVRVYLSAVARGDRDSAAAELAAPPAGALVEEGVVDGATQVRAVEVHGTGDIVTVDVDLKTSAGPYSAQFTVQKSPTGAALIADHSIIKS